MSRCSALLLLSLVACHPATKPSTEPPCTTSKRPIVAVHGFLAAGDTYALQAQRMAANGYCLSSVHAFDWDSLGDSSAADNLAALDSFIDAVRAQEKVDRVDLMGHSAGGGLAYNYLSDAGHAAKVAHYAHLASFQKPDSNAPMPRPAGPNGEVPTLNVYSDGDLIVMGEGDIPGATNVHLTTEDHYATATGVETFKALYAFFNDGQQPASTDTLKSSAIWLSGKALALGDNTPDVGAHIEVYAVDAATGSRLGAPVATLTADVDGAWGPVPAEAGVPYEFFVQPVGDGLPPVHYYREPFQSSDHLVYLRTIPDASSLAGALLSGVKYDDSHAVVVAFIANHGIIGGKDSLKIAGTETATATLAPASRNVIAVFAYDDNGNGRTDATTLSAFSSFPFLGGMDVFMDAKTPGSIPLSLNGHTLNVHNWPSATNGPIVAVFEE